MQLISYFDSIFPSELCWLRPYHIQAIREQSEGNLTAITQRSPDDYAAI